jgi:hypothetical protein
LSNAANGYRPQAENDQCYIQSTPSMARFEPHYALSRFLRAPFRYFYHLQCSRETYHTACTMAKTIFSLTPELLLRIAGLARHDTLLTLRLVCRELRDILNTRQVFATTCFSTVGALIQNEDSLRTLLAVAQHPTISHSVRKVILCTNVVSERPAGYASYAALPQCRSNLSEIDIKRNRKDAVADQNRFRHTAIDLALLTEIFTALQRHGKILEVQVRDMDESVSEPRPRVWRVSMLERTCRQTLRPAFDDDRYVRSFPPGRLLCPAYCEPFLPSSPRR